MNKIYFNTSSFSASSIFKIILQILLFFVLYLCSILLGSDVSLESVKFLPVWIPAGIALYAVLLFGYRVLPSIFIGIFLAINVFLLSINSIPNTNIQFASFIIALGDTIEIFLGAYLIKKIIKKNDYFNHPSSLARFIIITSVISIISASIGTTSLIFSGIKSSENYSTIWFTWFISHITSFVIITPFIFSLKSDSFVKWTLKKIIEAIILVVSLIIISEIIFTESFPEAIIFSSPYLVIPVLLWAIIKFSHREVAVVLIVLSAIAILNTVAGNGPFFNGSFESSILRVQRYLLIISVSTLLLNAALEELRAAEYELRLYRDELELKVAERSEKIKQNNQKLRKEIGERIETEKKLRELSEVVEQSPASVIITDKLGIIRYTNPKFTQMKGYTHEEVIGQNPNYFKSGIYDEKFYKSMWETILDGKIWQGEILNKKKNGQLFWELALISPILNEKGEIYRFVGIYEDITKQKEAEDEIEKYINKLSESEFQLQELNHNKDKFFSIIAHDLRSPFSSLLGFSEFLVNDFEELTLNEIKNYSINIHEAIKNTYKLLENLLDWAKLQKNKITLEFKMFYLINVAQKVFDLYSEDAIKKNIRLEMEIKRDCNIYADENTVYTVLRNLISNAIKFCKDGDIVSITAVQKDQHVEVSVKDTGIGMSSEDLEKLFRIDIHLSNIGTARERGTGLGLILCKEFLERNKGKISVESKLGIGTTFRFTLPIDSRI